MIRCLVSDCSTYQVRNISWSLRDSVRSCDSSTFLTICIVMVDAPRRILPASRLRRSAA
jgi:hypothetical protein